MLSKNWNANDSASSAVTSVEKVFVGPTLTAAPSPRLLFSSKFKVTEIPTGRQTMLVYDSSMTGLLIPVVSIVTLTTGIGSASSVVISGNGPAPPDAELSFTSFDGFLAFV